MECKGIDHYDVFDGDVIIFSVDISGVPEEIRSIAQEIDGCDYDPDRFGVWVNYDLADKEFYQLYNDIIIQEGRLIPC